MPRDIRSAVKRLFASIAPRSHKAEHLKQSWLCELVADSTLVEV